MEALECAEGVAWCCWTATKLIAWLSEILVGRGRVHQPSPGLSESLSGIIVVPLVGNVPSTSSAVQAAWKNKMELSNAVSIGSSLQIALFGGAGLVFVSPLLGNPLTLVFKPVEIIACSRGVLIGALVSQDGRDQPGWRGAVACTLCHPGARVLLRAG